MATALVLLTPYAGRLRPGHDPGIDTGALLASVRYSATTAYSGTVEVQGRVGLPIADRFSDLVDLFGGESRLRVWWRAEDSRVDRLLNTGEIDLFHQDRRPSTTDSRGDGRHRQHREGENAEHEP